MPSNKHILRPFSLQLTELSIVFRVGHIAVSVLENSTRNSVIYYFSFWWWKFRGFIFRINF